MTSAAIAVTLAVHNADIFLRDCARRSIRLVAHEPNGREAIGYREKIRQIADDHDLPNLGDIVFVEITVGDYSDFESRIEVDGEVLHDEFRVLTVTGASVPTPSRPYCSTSATRRA